ncbi:hypothetical protein J2R98_000928 [Alkalibacillus filiformis]|uniref:Uncharacterized protein n=1 Tax=Alkalibacillus filiformis TaxID=200990 RepID=A0ABU0DRY3_9BACI|nr:hypothetical protein [Alkalibacillus filiformis]
MAGNKPISSFHERHSGGMTSNVDHFQLVGVHRVIAL